jgi:hypothetical protein
VPVSSPPGNLERRLDAYSTTSKAVAVRSARRDRLGSWPTYCAATAAALASATSASAAIIYSGPVNVSAGIGFGHRDHASVFIPDHAGIIFGGSLYYAGRYPNFQKAGEWYFGFPNSISGMIPGVNPFANPFAYVYKGAEYRASIGAATTTKLFGVRILEHTSGPPFYRPVATNPPLYDNGWLRFRISSYHNLPELLTLVDYAYNSVPNAPIAPRQTTALPEPWTASMLLLAAGAAGVMAWKHRRKTGSTGPQSGSAQ